MPGSECNARAKELKKYVRDHDPTIIVLTNKPRQHYCALVDCRTGAVLHQADSNYRMLELITKPGFELRKATFRRSGFGISQSHPEPINTQADNAAEQIQRWVMTLMELTQSDVLPKLFLKENGLIEIKCKGIVFPIDNRKKN